MSVISVPEQFAADTLAREGDGARVWLKSLPLLVGALCSQWGLHVDGPPMHGYLGLVIPVLQANDRYVLKVSWICEDTANEAVALSVWNGNGAVRLLAEDRAAGAMLLERLDQRRSLAAEDLGVAVPIAGQLLRRLAVPAAVGAGRLLPGLGPWAQRMSAELPDRWQAVGRPFRRLLLDEAVELAAELASVVGTLLVDWDLHYANVLAARREPWLVIDPKVMVGDVEFGVAPLLWSRLDEVGYPSALRHRIAALIDAAGLDADLTRAWTLLHVIHYWLWGLSVGLTENHARCETLVDWLGLDSRS